MYPEKWIPCLMNSYAQIKIELLCKIWIYSLFSVLICIHDKLKKDTVQNVSSIKSAECSKYLHVNIQLKLFPIIYATWNLYMQVGNKCVISNF
jgi:hypothetical protein